MSRSSSSVCGELVERGVVVERAADELDVAGQPRPDLLPPRGAGVLLGRLVGQRLEVAVAPVAPGEAEHDEAGRQQPPVGQVVDGRDQLLAGQVAGDAEDHQSAGLRDPRQPAVLRVAQRVHAASSLRIVHVVIVTRAALRPHPAAGRRPPPGRSGAAAAAAAPGRPGPAGRRRPARPAARRRCTACPGTGRSSVTAPVIWRNAPTCGPPLWYWPVECRKRGPQPKVTGRPAAPASSGRSPAASASPNRSR